MNKLRLFFLALWGECLKLYYRMGLGRVPYGLNREEKRKERIVVSLTSYGRRVSKVVPYAVISLLRQTCKPDVIVLWLDSDQWNDDNLPPRLACLRKKGLTIRYCPDRIKSYTKLIPSLKAYPDDIVITVDDDIYYSKRTVEILFRSYKSNLQAVHALRTSISELSKLNNRKVFKTGLQLGTGGVLYPPHSLSKQVFDRETFMKICPELDDLWFYVMTVLNYRPIVKVKNASQVYYYYVDLFYQRAHKGSRLYDSVKLTNTAKLAELLRHFQISIDDLQ